MSMNTLLDLVNARGGNIPEIGPVPGGATYKLRIVKLEQRQAKSGSTYMQVTFALPDEVSADDIRHFVSFVPEAGDDSKDATRQLNDIMEFYKAFNLPLDLAFSEGDVPVAPAAVAAEGYAVLGNRPRKDDPNKRENTIIQWVIAQ